MILGALTFYAKSHYGSAHDANTYLLVLGSACVGTILTFIVVLGLKMFVVPADMHAERGAEIETLSKSIADAQERRLPKITILGLEQPPGDAKNAYYLRVQNKSDEIGVQGCHALIEELVDEKGDKLLTDWELRTEHQTGGSPEGRFDLDAGQTIRVLLCQGAGTPGSPIRIVAAQGKHKMLSPGNYTMRIRVFTDSGRPVDAKVAIAGSEIHFEGEI